MRVRPQLHGRDLVLALVADPRLDQVGGEHVPDRQVVVVGLERVEDGTEAGRHLLDLGHRRIALLNGREGLTFTLHRLAGYKEALRARGIDFDPKLVTHGDFTDEIGFHFARAALEQRPRPTAFVAGSMMTALGVYRAARTSNLVIGQDISVIAHDDVFPYLTAENMTPSLSTTRSSIRAAGSRITNLLLQILAGREATDVSELWPVELILRETSRPVSKEQST